MKLKIYCNRFSSCHAHGTLARKMLDYKSKVCLYNSNISVKFHGEKGSQQCVQSCFQTGLPDLHNKTIPIFFQHYPKMTPFAGFPSVGVRSINIAFPGGPGLKKIQPLATQVEPWTWQPCFKTNSFLLVNRMTSLNRNKNVFALM